MTRAWLWGRYGPRAPKEAKGAASDFANDLLDFHSWALLLTNEALEMSLIDRIKSLYGLLNLRVR